MCVISAIIIEAGYFHLNQFYYFHSSSLYYDGFVSVMFRFNHFIGSREMRTAFSIFNVICVADGQLGATIYDTRMCIMYRTILKINKLFEP